MYYVLYVMINYILYIMLIIYNNYILLFLELYIVYIIHICIYFIYNFATILSRFINVLNKFSLLHEHPNTQNTIIIYIYLSIYLSIYLYRYRYRYRQIDRQILNYKRNKNTTFNFTTISFTYFCDHQVNIDVLPRSVYFKY